MMTGMGRWEPNTRERLYAAALELFSERGFDQTTVAEIAQHAGLTERTYFRHFNDKREVLFGGTEMLEEMLAQVIADAPASTGPLDAVAAAAEAIGERMQGMRASVLRRQALVSAHDELRERELIKAARLSAACTQALRKRGVAPGHARLAAEAGMAAFHVAFERWVGDEAGDRKMPDVVRACFAELKQLAAGRQGS